jgi:hypothetical protein
VGFQLELAVEIEAEGIIFVLTHWVPRSFQQEVVRSIRSRLRSVLRIIAIVPNHTGPGLGSLSVRTRANLPPHVCILGGSDS